MIPGINPGVDRPVLAPHTHADYGGEIISVRARFEIAESALVNRQVQAVYGTRISAIPVRSPGAGSGMGMAADGPGGSKAKGSGLQTVTAQIGHSCGLR